MTQLYLVAHVTGVALSSKVSGKTRQRGSWTQLQQAPAGLPGQDALRLGSRGPHVIIPERGIHQKLLGR